MAVAQLVLSVARHLRRHFNLFCQLRASQFRTTVTDLRLTSSGGRTSWQDEPSLVRTENTCPLSLHTTSSVVSAPLRLHSTEKTMLVSRLHSSSSGVCCEAHETQSHLPEIIMDIKLSNNGLYSHSHPSWGRSYTCGLDVLEIVSPVGGSVP